MEFTPSYMELNKNGDLQERRDKAYQFLKECQICPHNCKVNRIKGEKGFCATGEKAEVASFFPHIGEEAALVGKKGSGTIFFSHCNLKCIFCQNYDISHHGHGELLDEKELGKLMIKLQEVGCHNINFVSPSHVVPQIISGIYEAVELGLRIPLVYNSGGYDALTSLKLMDGIVDIYLPDIKFGSDDTAYKYTGADNYFETARKALEEMYRQVGPLKTDEKGIAYRGIIVRHFVLPGHLSESEKVFDMIKRVSPETSVNVMGQYYPAHKAFKEKELSRPLKPQEINRARKIAEDMGLSVLKR